MVQKIKSLGLVGFLILSTVMPSSLSAQDVNPAQIRQILSSQVSSGNYDGARQTLASVSASRADFLYLEVEILAAQGKLDEAIKLLREVAAKNPQMSLARLKLAQLLIANRQLDSASFHFGILRDQAKSDNERAFFTKQIQDIEELQNWGVSAQFGLTPSTNINGAADRETEQLINGGQADLPDELKPQFGWRFSVSANAFYNLRIQDQHSLRTSLFAQTVMHTVDTIDYSNLSLSLDYQFQDARNDFSIGPFLQRYIGDGKSYLFNTNFISYDSQLSIVDRDEDYIAHGVSAKWRYILTPSQIISLNAKYSDTKYDDQERYGANNSYGYNFGVSYSHLYTPKHLGTVDLNYQRHVAAGNEKNWESFNSYTGLGFGLSLRSNFENQWQTQVGVSYAHRAYDELYPLTNLKREDEDYRVNLGVLNGNWSIGSLSPRLNCSFKIGTSNIESRESDTFDCGISMSYDF